MFIIGIIGIVSLGFGLYMRFGGAKVMYITPGIPVLMPQVVRNMFIPLGITLITWAVIWSDLISDIELGNTLFDYITMPMLAVTILLGIWNPRWLKPRWLNYLEDTYGPIMTREMLDIATENAREWLQQVKTQEGLENWARETCLALGYKLPEPEQSEEEEVRQILRELQELQERKAKDKEENSEG